MLYKFRSDPKNFVLSLVFTIFSVKEFSKKKKFEVRGWWFHHRRSPFFFCFCFLCKYLIGSSVCGFFLWYIRLGSSQGDVFCGVSNKVHILSRSIQIPAVSLGFHLLWWSSSTSIYWMKLIFAVINLGKVFRKCRVLSFAINLPGSGFNLRKAEVCF